MPLRYQTQINFNSIERKKVYLHIAGLLTVASYLAIIFDFIASTTYMVSAQIFVSSFFTRGKSQKHVMRYDI